MGDGTIKVPNWRKKGMRNKRKAKWAKMREQDAEHKAAVMEKRAKKHEEPDFGSDWDMSKEFGSLGDKFDHR